MQNALKRLLVITLMHYSGLLCIRLRFFNGSLGYILRLNLSIPSRESRAKNNLVEAVRVAR
jgi:hypothetical protein